MTGRTASRLLSRPKRRPAQVRSVLHSILMGAHRKSHSLGVLFANNKPDAARRATSDDDAVLISGEPEARDIGGRDRIAEDFVISHYHDLSRRVCWNSTTKVYGCLCAGAAFAVARRWRRAVGPSCAFGEAGLATSLYCILVGPTSS